MHAAREAGASARVDLVAALAWRDFMTNEWSNAGQAEWLAVRGMDLLRGSGRLAGPGVVDVDGVRYTARDVVGATSSVPLMPPIPGLAQLDGVWARVRRPA